MSGRCDSGPKPWRLEYWQMITQRPKEYAYGGKVITRKAQEPNPKGTAGREFVDKNGSSRYVYWDLEARNKKTNVVGDWRHATGTWNIKAI